MKSDDRGFGLWRIAEVLVWCGAATSLLPLVVVSVRDNSSVEATGNSTSGAVAMKFILVYAAIFATVGVARIGAGSPRIAGGISILLALAVAAGALGLYNLLLAPTAVLILLAGILMLASPSKDRSPRD